VAQGFTEGKLVRVRDVSDLNSVFSYVTNGDRSVQDALGPGKIYRIKTVKDSEISIYSLDNKEVKRSASLSFFSKNRFELL
jgi:hypothetical protein